MFDRLGLNRQALEEPLRTFVRPETERLQEELEKPDTGHYRRAAIGDRLNQIGDPREGVGVNAEELPQIKWLAVPGGRISLENNAGSRDVAPFYVAKYPVTYRQYRAFLIAEDGYNNKRWWKELKREELPGEQYRPIDNHPADTVSWYDAMAFCRWLSARLGYDVGLPTEYQWQQAATVGKPENDFPWGPEWDERLANTDESHLGRTTAVGMYPLGGTGGSPEGVLDMAGNVREWCLNKYDNPDDTRMSGDETRVETRVWRGGSWYFYQDSARAAVRDNYYPFTRNYSLGFRLCCESPIT
jgi:formylglycine-generating enzyme required for sulfatase activity